MTARPAHHLTRPLHVLRIEDVEPPPGWTPCCMGAAVYGPGGCTCEAERAYEARLRDRPPNPPRPRESRCETCACRIGSPEWREAHLGTDEGVSSSLHEVERRAASGWPFYCHDGMPKGDAEHSYKPPICRETGIPLKADGTAADLCAGWARLARAAGHDWFDRGEWWPDGVAPARPAPLDPTELTLDLTPTQDTP